MNVKISKFKFYLLSFTWGLPMTLIGCLAALVLIITGHHPKPGGYCYYFEIGEDWGGCELGTFFITDKTNSSRIKNHELGHGIQNCYLGFAMPFVVCIPSGIRYWCRKYLTQIKGVTNLKPYDSIWFEGQATKLGTEFIDWYTSKNA